MPFSNPIPSGIRAAALLLTAALVAGCASTPPDPSLLKAAEESIALAEQSGAAERAPLELENAYELYHAAQAQLQEEETEAAIRYAERAGLQARLALARAQGAAAREELQKRREAFTKLESELRDAFGEELEWP